MAALPPAVARVRGALREFLTERRAEGALADGDLLLAACSGGADSVALAAQLAFLAPRLGLRGGLVTVDHGMQEGSAHQAARVARLGRDLGLDPVLIKTPELPSAGGLGPEGQAREMRYAALEHAVSGSGARAVLLGHTMEDQAETVFLGLLRGAGTRAVAGMRPERGNLWRPLLRVRRADTEAACRDLGISVWQDPANQPDGPWRTVAGGPLPRAALRHHFLPALHEALEQDPIPPLARTAELAAADSDLLEALAAEHFRLIHAAVPGAGEARASIDTDELQRIPAPLRWRVLRELLIRAGAPAAQISMTHVRGVDALVVDWRGQRGASVPGGLQVRRTCGRLEVVTQPPLERT